ncbi:MAG: hypothetical protein HYR96_09805 [Deltaproteobacteria bacterium]|nr:hypothetical protein [Deltaproteobacteria bacterium]MBI3294388.1 hypothetical protein [Deltaproteobacteria bacterium]
MRWCLLILMLTSSSWGYVLRARAVPLQASYQGALPELRVEDDGRVQVGSSRSNRLWRTVKQLSEFEIETIKAKLRSVPRKAQLKRWYSRTFCAAPPLYQYRFDGNDGEVFLGLGDICLGGGVENSNARSLISLLGRDLAESAMN